MPAARRRAGPARARACVARLPAPPWRTTAIPFSVTSIMLYTTRPRRRSRAAAWRTRLCAWPCDVPARSAAMYDFLKATQMMLQAASAAAPLAPRHPGRPGPAPSGLPSASATPFVAPRRPAALTVRIRSFTRLPSSDDRTALAGGGTRAAPGARGACAALEAAPARAARFVRARSTDALRCGHRPGSK